jgi:dolichol-phosphate mannosyltransferase
VDRLIHHRFIKFGTIGLSGTVVNVAVLTVNQEIIFRSIDAAETRLRLSLAIAIFLATINNFLWNRAWTWGDRRGKTKHGFIVQMGQYFLASWLSIALQFFLTTLLARFVHYLPANIISIILAAIVTFVLNDVWTFSIKRTDSEPVSRGKSIARDDIDNG